MTSEATSYNDRIVREFRAHAGHVGGEWAGTPLILVHHVGARSGTERVTPLGCFPLGDGRYAVAASSGGSPQHPAWYHNLKANPETTAWWKGETRRVRARDATGAERDRLWKMMAAAYPEYESYQRRTDRQIPVVVLEPAEHV